MWGHVPLSLLRLACIFFHFIFSFILFIFSLNKKNYLFILEYVWVDLGCYREPDVRSRVLRGCRHLSEKHHRQLEEKRFHTAWQWRWWGGGGAVQVPPSSQPSTPIKNLGPKTVAVWCLSANQLWCAWDALQPFIGRSLCVSLRPRLASFLHLPS